MAEQHDDNESVKAKGDGYIPPVPYDPIFENRDTPQPASIEH